MKVLHVSRLLFVWVAAALLALLPALVAMDFGGVLRWTHFVVGIALLATTVLATTAYWDQPNRGQLRQHVLLVPLVVWCFYAGCQTLPLSPGIVKILSPGSHAAYTQWLQTILPAGQMPETFSVSVSPHDSKHAVAMLALVISTVFASALVFCTRRRITFLLNAISIGVSLHVGYGLLRLVFPGVDLYDRMQDLSPASFGTFINRNNAALFMNLGLGCSLGLLSWRLTALTGQELDDDQFEFNDLVSLIGDRDSMIGVACAVVCIGGLLICGSRGGIVSILFGLLLAFGWVRQKRGFATLPILAVVVGISAAVLLVPLQLNMKSLERFEFLSSETRTFASDGRLQHWPDGFRTAVSHLPAGSGLSTYAFSTLPHQSGNTHSWAQHADNLWLELFVEQGVFGALVVLAILYLMVRSLALLRASPDPIDQGLRAAGWYILGALACSQFFDFGLILPANFLLLCVVFPAIVARQVSIAASSETSEKIAEGVEIAEDDELVRRPVKQGSIFAQKKRAPVFVGIAVAVVALPALAMPRLKRDAEIELLVRSAQFQLKSLRSDSDGLKQWSERLVSALGANPEPQLLDALADYKNSQARLSEVVERRPKNVDEFVKLLRENKPVERTYESQLTSPAVTEQYQEAVSWHNQSLRILPLGIQSRSGRLYLDFVSADKEVTRTLIKQLFSLHRNNPSVLMLLGEYAANRDEFALAIKSWETAASERVGLTANAVSLSLKHEEIGLADVVPQMPKAVRFAASSLLKNDDKDSLDYLQSSLDELSCDQCDYLEERSRCLVLHGDVAYKLGHYDEAFKKYASAIQSNPSDAEVRLKLIRRLRDQNRLKQARAEAVQGRTVLSSDKRFDSLIKAIAEDDLRRIGE